MQRNTGHRRQFLAMLLAATIVALRVCAAQDYVFPAPEPNTNPMNPGEMFAPPGISTEPIVGAPQIDAGPPPQMPAIPVIAPPQAAMAVQTSAEAQSVPYHVAAEQPPTGRRRVIVGLPTVAAKESTVVVSPRISVVEARLGQAGPIKRSSKPAATRPSSPARCSRLKPIH
ncbi:MAG: hypothetical protein QM775_10915 [Pirellulales bacterium]